MFKCTECGKLTAGRVPKDGDRTFRHPRKHYDKNGDVCSGCYQEAEWIDVKFKGDKDE